MVWGVVEPSRFGDFFPKGDYVGWKEGIKLYFAEECLPSKGRRSTLMERPKSLGSLIILNDRLLAVDATSQGIIETLEPGEHQFWPIRITLRNGNEYAVPYYGMIIRRFIDSFAPEQSDVRQAGDSGASIS
jgi:hypothetical protein